MKNYLMYAAIGILIVIIVFCFNKEVQADTVSASYVNTSYDLSFPADVFLDDSSNGWQVSYGFEITPSWSLDLGYADLGKAEQTIIFIPTAFEVELLTIVGHGRLSIGTLAGHDIKLHGLLGVARGDARVTVGANSLSDDDMGVIYGVGLGVMLSPIHEIKAMYKKTSLTFDNTVAFNYDPSMFEIGYSFHF